MTSLKLRLTEDIISWIIKVLVGVLLTVATYYLSELSTSMKEMAKSITSLSIIAERQEIRIKVLEDQTKVNSYDIKDQDKEINNIKIQIKK